MTIVPAQSTSVYKYYDELGILLYVGITKRGTARQVEHNTGKSWWNRVRRQEVEHYDGRELAAARERSLIERYRPPFNVQHNPDSDATRAAYEAMSSASAPGASVFAAVEALPQRRLSLHVYNAHDQPHLVLATHPKDLVIAANLQWQADTPVIGLGRRSRVVSIRFDGTVAYIETRKHRNHRITRVWADIRFKQSCKPSLWIKAVHATEIEDA